LGAKKGADVCAKFRARTRKPTKEDVDDAPAPARLAYRVDEACALLGVSRDTIERAVKDGRLRSSKRLGRRLIDARSIEALFDDTSEG
jgi:excisionase family DNA binding protein